jgi:hypothetical protein
MPSVLDEGSFGVKMMVIVPFSSLAAQSKSSENGFEHFTEFLRKNEFRGFNLTTPLFLASFLNGFPHSSLNYYRNPVCPPPLAALGIVIFGSAGSVSFGSWSIDAVAESGCIAFSFCSSSRILC